MSWEHDAPLYPQGHGHAKTVVYGATWTSGPLPTFSDAVQLTEFTGTVFAHPTNPSTTWHLWIKWVTVDEVESPAPAGGTNGVVVTTGLDVSAMVAAMTGPGNPFTILAVDTIINGVTYPAGTYTTKALIFDAQISNAKIANIIEYGKSGQPAKPFLKPAKSATKKTCAEAMKAKLEQELGQI